MMDYLNASRIARMEYEERIRSIIPPQDFEDRLKDDRLLSVSPLKAGIAERHDSEPVSVVEQVGRLVYSVGNGLASVGESMMQKRMSLEGPQSERK